MKKTFFKLASIILAGSIMVCPIFATQAHEHTENCCKTSEVVTESHDSEIDLCAVMCCDKPNTQTYTSTKSESLSSHDVVTAGSILRRCYDSRTVTYRTKVCKNCGANYGTTTSYGPRKHSLR